MSENVDALRNGYDAFAREDMEGVMALYADDIEWQGPNAPELPGAGTHNGKEEVAAMLGRVAEDWDPFGVTPDEFVDGGDTVVVLGHIEATAKGTGTNVKAPFVHVWRMSGGTAQRVQTLTDTAVVLDALNG